MNKTLSQQILKLQEELTPGDNLYLRDWNLAKKAYDSIPSEDKTPDGYVLSSVSLPIQRTNNKYSVIVDVKTLKDKEGQATFNYNTNSWEPEEGLTSEEVNNGDLYWKISDGENESFETEEPISESEEAGNILEELPAVFYNPDRYDIGHMGGEEVFVYKNPVRYSYSENYVADLTLEYIRNTLSAREDLEYFKLDGVDTWRNGEVFITIEEDSPVWVCFETGKSMFYLTQKYAFDWILEHWV